MWRISTFALVGIAVLFAGFTTAGQPPQPRTESGAGSAAGDAPPFWLDKLPEDGPTAITNASDSRIVVFADRRIRGIVGRNRVVGFVVQPGASLQFTKGRRITGWLILPDGQCVPVRGAQGAEVFAGTPMPVGMKGPSSLCGLMPMAEDTIRPPEDTQPPRVTIVTSGGCCDVAEADKAACIKKAATAGIYYKCPQGRTTGGGVRTSP